MGGAWYTETPRENTTIGYETENSTHDNDDDDNDDEDDEKQHNDTHSL